MLLRRWYICAVVFLIFLSSALAVKSEEVEYDFSKVEHVIKPRHIRIYSRPPGEDQEMQTGRGLHNHLDNALQGGTVGVEFNLKKLKEKFSGFMEKARKYLPFLYRLKKKPIEDSEDRPRNSPKDSGEDPDSDSKPRLDKSNEVDDEEFSMEFEMDPRRINMNPEDIVLLEREKLVSEPTK